MYVEATSASEARASAAWQRDTCLTPLHTRDCNTCVILTDEPLVKPTGAALSCATCESNLRSQQLSFRLTSEALTPL